MSSSSLAVAARRVLGWFPLALGPVLLLTAFVHDSPHGPLAFDFLIGLKTAARFVHGHSLYGSSSPVYYVYPPLFAESTTPFLLIPEIVARWIASLVCVLCVVLGLWRCGVRDARVVGLALCTAPVIHGCEWANPTFVVFVLVAFAWSGSWPAMGVAVALKFVAWPLLLWQAAARGLRTGVGAACLALGLVLGSWALIGFEGLGAYPRLLRNVTTTQEHLGYSASAAFAGGRYVAVALTIAALVRGFVRMRAGDQTGGIAYAIAAVLAAAPYVYDNYFTFVLIPLALRRPTLSAAWVLPLLFWFGAVSDGPTLTTRLIAWGVFGSLLVWTGEGAPTRPVAMRPVPAST